MEIVLIIILFIYVVSQKRRVDRLEEQLRGRAPIAPLVVHDAVPGAVPAPTGAAPVMYTPIPAASALVAPVSIPTPVNTEVGFISWIKRDFFVKLGALLLLCAFGWFVSYAFANNWIGPWGRILSGIAAGAVVLGFGAYRMRQLKAQGGIFVVLGAVIIIMSLWAAREIYDFFTPTLALALMLVPIVCTAILSVIHRLQGLAIASLILASTAPFFTAAPEPSLFGLSIYLLLVVVGTLWVGFLIDSLFLTPAALLVVALWSLPYIGGVAQHELTQGMLFAFAFTICFFVSNILSLLNHHTDAAKTSHVLSGLGTGVYLYIWIATATSGWLESALYAAWMAIFLLAGFFVFTRTARSVALYIYGAVALAYLVALTANLFDGMVLTMVYAAELALLIVATRFIPVERRARQVLSWLYAPLCLVALQHVFSPSWTNAVLHRDFAALVIVTASLIVSGISLRRGSEEQRHLQASTALLVTAGISLLILHWLILNALLADRLAATLFFMTTAIFGVVLYAMGVRLASSILRACGGFLSVSYLFLISLSFTYIDSPEWADGIIHLDAAVLTTITAAFWLATIVAAQAHIRAASKTPFRLLSSLALLYSLNLIWLVIHGLLSAAIATTVCLVLYTLIGLGLFVCGQLTSRPFIKYWGGALLCAVVLRLLFVEIWALSLTARIITFFLVGLLLISTAFIKKVQKSPSE